jgi:hypothetical protein
MTSCAVVFPLPTREYESSTALKSSGTEAGTKDQSSYAFGNGALLAEQRTKLTYSGGNRVFGANAAQQLNYDPYYGTARPPDSLYNCIIGANVAATSTNISFSTIVGASAMQTVGVSFYNVAIGYEAAKTVQNAMYNVILGSQASVLNNSKRVIVIGAGITSPVLEDAVVIGVQGEQMQLFCFGITSTPQGSGSWYTTSPAGTIQAVNYDEVRIQN